MKNMHYFQVRDLNAEDVIFIVATIWWVSSTIPGRIDKISEAEFETLKAFGIREAESHEEASRMMKIR